MPNETQMKNESMQNESWRPFMLRSHGIVSNGILSILSIFKNGERELFVIAAP